MSRTPGRGLGKGSGKGSGGLGRGLASLLGEEPQADPAEGGVREIALDALRPSPLNPRRQFDEEGLEDLARSIGARGLVQPIVARAAAGGMHEIIAGERRYRAAGLAGLETVPVLLIEADDAAVLEIAIIENVQRADLTGIEEARGYADLTARFGYTQADLARTVAKSRSHVANTLRLLKLPEPVQDHIDAGRLTAGQARPLIGHPDAEALARRIIAEGMSAREVERLVSAAPTAPKGKDEAPAERDTRLAEITERFTRRLGSDVRIGRKRGQVTVTLPDDDAVERLLALLDG
ncbi:MAG: ParB/RepB/Spo0J family partition protein [Pseudomonadota bacterium]